MNDEPKDRLIQTRVPERLEITLKEEARKRRTTVSQMIRNILEDAFHLVDGVVANVDQILSDSVELAQQVSRQGLRARGSHPDSTPCGEPLPGAREKLAKIDAWNEAVLNRPVPCTKCGVELAKGRRVYAGLGARSAERRAWLCRRAVDALRDDPGH